MFDPVKLDSYVKLTLLTLVLADYRQWMTHHNKAEGPQSPSPESSSSAMDPPLILSERMRKRRAFADRDLEAVMFQREQQEAVAAAAESSHRQHYPRYLPAFLLNPPVSIDSPAVSSSKEDDEDEDCEVDVLTEVPPTPSRSSKISFSVESIIGRP